MLRQNRPRRGVFHGGQRSAQVIKVAANVKVRKAKRLERAQLGYQLKHLRAAAFKKLPKKLQTPELRKAMYDLTIFDKRQFVGTPSLIGPLFNRGNNVSIVKYHDDSNSIVPQKPDIAFDDVALKKILPYIKQQDEKLANLLVTYQKRYQQLCEEIRVDQFPAPKPFGRPVDSRETTDLIQINEQFQDENADAKQIEDIKKKLTADEQKHIEEIDTIYKKLSNPDLSFAEQDALVEELCSKPVLPCEYSFMRLPTGIRPTKALTARVYQILSHPIDYLDLYRAVFRGKQKRMSKKVMKELEICRYATKHLTDEEFQNLNPHRAAVLTWKLMNSDDVDNDSVAAMMNYNDRMLDRTDRAQVHHNPELMADSWIVEAFNNRHNTEYSVEIIKAAKAADADLNRFKLFLNDTELVPRRLNVFLGLNYIKQKATLPGDGMESFFRALNHCRFPGQINTLLKIAVIGTPNLVVPPGAIYEALVAANKMGAYSTVAPLANYVRHTTGLGWDKALPMDYRTGSIYVDSLQQLHMKEQKRMDWDPNSETAATIVDMSARGVLPPIFSQDPIDAFLIPEDDAVDSLTLLGGNTDPRTQPQVQRNKNYKELRAKQLEQDANVVNKLATFNVNVQHHVLPTVALTAVNYALRTLIDTAKKNNLLFRKPVRLYISNMQSLLEDFNKNQMLANDRRTNAGTKEQINTDLEGNPIYDPKKGKVFGPDDISVLNGNPATGLLDIPTPSADDNQEYINLTKVFDTVDMLDNIADEKRAPINPHVAHLVEQCMPTIAYNPHIYEDVLDIIYIKTGVGTDDKGLRNPDVIDNYLAKKVQNFLKAFNVAKPIVNKRFGYIEISTPELNKMLELDMDKALEIWAHATERELQYNEKVKPRFKEGLFMERLHGDGVSQDLSVFEWAGNVADVPDPHKWDAAMAQRKDWLTLPGNEGKTLQDLEKWEMENALAGKKPIFADEAIKPFVSPGYTTDYGNTGILSHRLDRSSETF